MGNAPSVVAIWELVYSIPKTRSRYRDRTIIHLQSPVLENRHHSADPRPLEHR
ncbi:hypothetical protein [Halomicronema sp. CCY15110]|uniref:hypothetical protein n=1 Tax=Halomicronema sp. CCY15110 TaxID=2767773 RepID=UPI0019505296|nr:hypothetical protein [Halomicronema sp. CCY15110]